MCIKKWIFKIYYFIFDTLVFRNEHGILLYTGPQAMLVNMRVKMLGDRFYALDSVYLTGVQQIPFRGFIGSPVALTSGIRSRVTVDGTIKSNMNIVLSAFVSSSALTTIARRRNSINPPCSAKWSV